MDAYAAGSTANINMNRGQFDYWLIPLGLIAIIVSLVLHLKEKRIGNTNDILPVACVGPLVTSRPHSSALGDNKMNNLRNIASFFAGLCICSLEIVLIWICLRNFHRLYEEVLDYHTLSIIHLALLVILTLILPLITLLVLRRGMRTWTDFPRIKYKRFATAGFIVPMTIGTMFMLLNLAMTIITPSSV